MRATSRGPSKNFGAFIRTQKQRGELVEGVCVFVLLGEGRNSLILSVSKGNQFESSLGYT